MAGSKKPVPQAAALPVRGGEVCLVTSSNGKNWIFPKGMIDAGHSAEQAALQEAWEEAGLRGMLDPSPLGNYRYEKWGLLLEVTVYLMWVERVVEEWPEKSLRRRRWMSWDEARQRLNREEFRRFLQEAQARAHEHSGDGV
jgi:8-oxo-dGTP pyrophosphatase MutT (NUDIX family)